MNKDTQDQIAEVCDSIKQLLLEKNAKYGDSALYPQRVFSKADAVEQIKVRIDDKLSRIATTGFSAIDEDTLQDLIGYLVLLKIALMRRVSDVSYDDVLQYYGQSTELDEAWAKTPDYVTGWTWDDSIGPVENVLTEDEIQEILAKKTLDKFERDEIVATVDKRGFILGIKKDGTTCELRNGRCA